jgi:hypothetical protein
MPWPSAAPSVLERSVIQLFLARLGDNAVGDNTGFVSQNIRVMLRRQAVGCVETRYASSGDFAPACVFNGPGRRQLHCLA